MAPIGQKNIYWGKGRELIFSLSGGQKAAVCYSHHLGEGGPGLRGRGKGCEAAKRKTSKSRPFACLKKGRRFRSPLYREVKAAGKREGRHVTMLYRGEESASFLSHKKRTKIESGGEEGEAAMEGSMRGN